MHGKGKLTLKDGETYVGNFKDNMKNGFGVFTWNNGVRYEGEWK